MGESENQESDFVRVVTALFKEDIEDAVKSVYKTRIKPTIKRTASDSLKDIIDRLFGTTPTAPNIPAGSVQAGQQRTNYGKISTTAIMSSSNVSNGTALPSQSNASRPVASESKYNALPNFVMVDSFENAQNIVNALNDIIREDSEATVNDLFDFAGKSGMISGNSAAARYGWDNIDGHNITEMPDGKWMLAMPPYKYLGKGN